MNVLENHPIDTLQIGQAATYVKTLLQSDIYLFAACSGDINPVHLDKAFAATTPFGEPIAHGMWTGALISAAIATQLPGPGSIYRSQSLSFKFPVKVGDVLTVTLVVEEIKLRNKSVVLNCEVTNQDGKVVAKGTAEVIAPTEKLVIPAGVLPDIQIS